MSIQELNSLGEFIGSLAVIITLIYLAVQVRQNTSMMRNSAAQSVISMGRDVTNTVMMTPGLAETLMKVRAGEVLDHKEEFLRNLWSQNVLRASESFYLLWREGLVSDTLWQSRRAGAKLAAPLITDEWWSQNKLQFEQSFVEMIEEVREEVKHGDV